jgi:hypothetical protein
MRVVSSALVLLAAASAAAAQAGQTAGKPVGARGVITGTIQGFFASHYGSPVVNRIAFSLEEHPEKNFSFEPPGREIQGRYLFDGLDGLRVQVSCKKVEEGDDPDNCAVATMRFLNARPNLAAITGTITNLRGLAGIPLGGPAPAPAKIQAVSFGLKEHPGKRFEFYSQGSSRQGSRLDAGLEGVRVSLRVYCPASGQPGSDCDVASLTRLVAAPPSGK